MPSLNQRLGTSRYDADQAYSRALAAFRRGEKAEAIAAMDEAIALLPTRSEYFAARGFFHLENDAATPARADFEHALRLFSVEVLALYGMGVLAYRAGETEAAIGHFRRAHFADPKRPELLVWLALAQLQVRQFAAATEAMTRAHTLFEAAGDRRKAETARWLREIGRAAGRAGRPVAVPLLADEGAVPPDLPPPLPGLGPPPAPGQPQPADE
jgi:tetratricopeptide (TPR) repeat protein